MITIEHKINPVALLGSDVTEVRIIAHDSYKTRYGGFFDNAQEAYNAAMQWDTKGEVYLTLNELDPALMARRNGGKIIKLGKGEGASDNNVTRRRWLLIDADPERARGVSSTDTEKLEAVVLINSVQEFLALEGFKEPVFCNSGNGYHLLYRVDLPNSKESTDLVKSVLKILAARFSNDKAKIDTAVFNAARITKFYGVTAMKGKDTKERPHRRSGIVTIPASIKITLQDVLLSFVEKYKPVVSSPVAAPSRNSGFDLDDWIAKHGIRIKEREPTSDGGTHYILADGCPFNPEHAGKDAVLYRHPNGAIGFKCFHDSCAGNGWKQFRLLYEPDAYNTRSTATQDFGDVYGRTEYNKAAPALSIISAAELQTKDIPPICFIVNNLLPQGLALLASPPKYGKSWWVLDLCLCVAFGDPFLGHNTTSSGCLYLALEDSERRLKDRMEKILNGRKAPINFDYATTSHDISNGLIAELGGYLSKKATVKLIVIDTLQKVRSPATGKDSAYAADYKEVGALKSFADAHGVCLLLVHHLRKMADDTDPFNRISGTNGIMGAADTAMVMAKAKRGDDSTTLSITGRDIESNEIVITFDKQLYRWRVLGNADVLAEQRARLEYENSPIVLTIKKLLEISPSGWKGTAQDLMAAGKHYLHAYISDTPRALSNKLKALSRSLYENDGIIYEKTKNGSGGGLNKFYSCTVGYSELTIGEENPHQIELL